VVGPADDTTSMRCVLSVAVSGVVGVEPQALVASATRSPHAHRHELTGRRR
jgi:hypothetical protein